MLTRINGLIKYYKARSLELRKEAAEAPSDELYVRGIALSNTYNEVADDLLRALRCGDTKETWEPPSGSDRSRRRINELSAMLTGIMNRVDNAPPWSMVPPWLREIRPEIENLLKKGK